MSLLHDLVEWSRGRSHVDTSAVHAEVRHAVHRSRNYAHAAMAQPVVAARASKRVCQAADRTERAAYDAIALIETARGGKKCDD